MCLEQSPRGLILKMIKKENINVVITTMEEWVHLSKEIDDLYKESKIDSGVDLSQCNELSSIMTEIFDYKDLTQNEIDFDEEEIKIIKDFYSSAGDKIEELISSCEFYWENDIMMAEQGRNYLNFADYCMELNQEICEWV